MSVTVEAAAQARGTVNVLPEYRGGVRNSPRLLLGDASVMSSRRARAVEGTCTDTS
jgi:hypothetical protein